MKLSIAFQSDKRLHHYGELAALVERYGFDTITLYEDLGFQPAWQPLHVMAQHTSRVRLGPAVVNPYLRHPLVIAGEVALLNEAAQGRAYLGVGRGAFLQALRLPQPQPITAVRETITLVKRFLGGGTTPYHGKLFSATAAATLRWQPPYPDVPILIGTWGPKMAALAAEVADEVKIGGCWNPDFVPLMRDYIVQGAQQVGRNAAEIGIVVGAVTVVSEDRREAEAVARREVALYLPVVLALDKTLQVAEEEKTAVVAALDQGDIETAARRLSTATLKKLACCGTPHDIIEQVAAFREAGVARVEFGTPHGPDEVAAIKLLGEKVLPHFQ